MTSDINNPLYDEFVLNYFIAKSAIVPTITRSIGFETKFLVSERDKN